MGEGDADTVCAGVYEADTVPVAVGDCVCVTVGDIVPVPEPVGVD